MSSIILLADLEPRTTAAGKTEVVGQIARCLAVQALVNQCRQLESDTLSHRQPMKRLENRRNVVSADKILSHCDYRHTVRKLRI